MKQQQEKQLTKLVDDIIKENRKRIRSVKKRTR